MWKNNFWKYFLKINVKKTVLFTMILGIFIFSFYSLFRIDRMNYWIKKECEKRVYTDWTKEEKVIISRERKSELEYIKEKISQCPEYLLMFSKNKITSVAEKTEELERCGLSHAILYKDFSLIIQGEIDNILDRGYEFRSVSDEEKRAISRQEVNDYQECLKNQKEAIKERPEAYKFLMIVDLVILVSGFLVLKFW